MAYLLPHVVYRLYECELPSASLLVATLVDALLALRVNVHERLVLIMSFACV
jgi:hypothetical protein